MGRLDGRVAIITGAGVPQITPPGPTPTWTSNRPRLRRDARLQGGRPELRPYAQRFKALVQGA